MKICKKMLCVVLTLIMCFSVVPMTNLGMKAEAYSYNATAALEYAKNHWNDGVGLCAEFVSNCLKAGGLKSWSRGCTSLVSQMISNGEGTRTKLTTSGNYILASKNTGKFSLGDPIFWRCDNCGYYMHTGLISGIDSSGYITHYAHNSAQNNKRIWVGSCYDCGSAYSGMYVMHFSGESIDPDKCSCSESNKGNYICTASTSLLIRSGHSTSYASIGSIPSGAKVYVSKASSEWAHVEYNGITGYSSMRYLSKEVTHTCTGYHINLSYNTVGGKFYDSNSAVVTVIPKIDGRDAYDSEINSVTIFYKLPDGTVKSKNLGKNTEYKFYIGNGGNSLAGTYIFWAKVDTVYGSSEGGIGDGDVELTLSRVSLSNGSYNDDIVYRRVGFEDINRYLTVDSQGNVISYERKNSSSNDQSQIWKFIKNSDGTYTIESVENGNVLDVTKGVYVQGTNVITYTPQGSDNQKWYLSKNSDGDWFIRAASSNSAVIDVEEANSANGTNVALWTYNGSAAQKITFKYPYQITYNSNGGSGEPNVQYKDYNKSVTLSSTKPTRSGYTFLGWSTSSSATSASYSAGASYSSNADLNLYAVWKKNPTYTLSYSANGGSGAPSSQTGASSYTISSTEPTKTGYTFRGWAKSSSATTATYKSGDTINISENTTLYAIWKKVFYGDVNGDQKISVADLTGLNNLISGTGVTALNKLKGDLDGDEKLTSTDAELLQSFMIGKIFEFPVESIFFDFVVTNNGKSTYKSGEAINKSEIKAFVTYNNANYHTIDEGLTVSPEYVSGSGQQKITVTLGDWSDYFYITVDNTVGYTLSYNANGGSGAPSGQTGSTSYTVSSTVPTRNGYTFLGWAKISSATTPAYKPGNNISVSANTTLYAVWSSASAISTGSSYSTSVEFANQERYYTFTPSTSGDYIFESTGSLDTKVYVYNTSWTELGNDDDDGADSNFMLKINLTAGTKYYVKVRAYSSKTGSTSFSVKKEAPVTYTLNYNANGGSNAPSSQTGATTYAISSTVPTRQGYTFLGWAKSSNASIAPYTPGDIVTLTTDTTLYAVWKVAEAMEVFEGYEVSIDFAKQELYYTFTPDISGEYMFESFSSIDTKVYVYDSSWKQIGFNDDDGVGNNFLLYVNLTAGNKYYVKVGAYGSGTGNLTFGVACEEEEHEHSYSSTVTKQPGCVSYGTREFKCSCGDTYTETINPLGHNFETEWTIDKKATCTEDGKKSYHCVRCDIGSAEETIKATGHDFDGSKCKNCDYDKSSDCSCNCHKGGISGFFFKIILFFQKLFGSNKTCACGVAHY